MDSDYNETPSLQTHIIEFFETLAVFLAIGALVYYLFVQPHKVSGLSMYPNFHNGDYILTDKISYRFHEPERGDVVIFKNPRDTTQDFIKRIIGLPGDHVKVENGHVYLNGALLNEPYLKPEVVTDPRTFMADGEDILVPDGNYIVFGDNRPGSSDSREWGLMPKANMIGRAFFRYWPHDSIGLIPTYHLP